MSSLLRDMRGLLAESKDIEKQLRDKLREIATAAKHRYKAKSPEDLADELEELLKQANLSKPPALSPKQYDAVAGVWQALGDEPDEVERAAGRALMQMSEADNTPRKPMLGERAGAGKEATKTLESMQRWLKGAFPTVNSYAKKMAGVKNDQYSDKAVQSEIHTVADTLDQMVTLLTRLDGASKKALGKNESLEEASLGLHLPAQADDAIGTVYRTLVDFKLGMDQMEEVPKDLQPLYKATMKAMDAVSAARKDVYQLRMMTQKAASRFGR